MHTGQLARAGVPVRKSCYLLALAAPGCATKEGCIDDRLPIGPEARAALSASLDSWCARPALDPRERLLILAGGATARGDDATEELFRYAIARGVAHLDVSEIVLQTYLFAGFPRAINALTALHGVARKSPDQSRFVEGRLEPPAVRERGEALCKRVYGPAYARLRTFMHALHADFDDWMIEDGYGRVLARGHVPVVVRELAAVTALIVLGTAPQLRAHLAGARNVGATNDAIAETVRQSALFADAEPLAMADRIWSQLG